jgi:xanthine/uracil permease
MGSGKTDFSRVGDANWIAISAPFHFGHPTFRVAAVMLVIMTETTADILAIGEIVDRPAGGRVVVRRARRAGVGADHLCRAPT